MPERGIQAGNMTEDKNYDSPSLDDGTLLNENDYLHHSDWHLADY